VHPLLVQVLSSWLSNRTAHVVVGGAQSVPVEMADMVYQGTVWGPPLWNTFFGDSCGAIRSTGFSEVVYADDLNAFKAFCKSISNVHIMRELLACQRELHKWGQGSQVTFDPAKESFHVLAKSDHLGGNFKILGINFDPKLGMQDCVHELVTDCGWKLRTLLRTRRFHTDAELIRLYKAHLLSYMEYRTPAIAHASCSVLAPLDRVQERFLSDIGVNELDAFLNAGAFS